MTQLTGLAVAASMTVQSGPTTIAVKNQGPVLVVHLPGLRSAWQLFRLLRRAGLGRRGIRRIASGLKVAGLRLRVVTPTATLLELGAVRHSRLSDWLGMTNIAIGRDKSAN